MLGLFANRICGSADIYTKSGKGPGSSVNFITCHDGFTLNDLVSYRNKHNEANGHGNQDGTDSNVSQNYACEGETTDANVEALRKAQIKNFLLTLLISRGVPMLLGGDEVRRTQGGNNNAYCQDNETSWHNWTYLERHKDILRFTRGMLAFRRAHPILSEEHFYTDTEIRWYGRQGRIPDWGNPQEKQLICVICEDDGCALCLIFNAGADGDDIVLPRAPSGTAWHLAVDTSRDAPRDLFAPSEEPLLQDPHIYHVSSRSSCILLARPTTSDPSSMALNHTL